MRRRGFTLSEVLVSCMVLSLALMVCFQLFQWCSRAALLGQSRASLEGEGRRLLLSLRMDLMRSDFDGLESETARSVVNAQGQTVDRHALSFPCLDNWSHPGNFNPDSASPRWNRYLVLYATTAQPGLLVKQFYAPAGAPYQGPMGNLGGLLADDPAANPLARSHQVLSQNLESFQVKSDDSSKVVELHWILARRGGRKGEAGSLNERHQLSLATRLENSGP